MKLATRSRSRALVSLTPLIDVVFILLIFFMLASNFVDWQYIELGVNDTEEIELVRENLSTIQIRQGDVYMLDDQEMKLEAIISIVRERCRLDIDHPVLIKPEQGTRLQVLVYVLERIGEFAAGNVSLTKPDRHDAT